MNIDNGDSMCCSHVRYRYDNANRPIVLFALITSKTTALKHLVMMPDAAGNKASSANNLVGYSFIYDRLNRLTQKLNSRNAQPSFHKPK